MSLNTASVYLKYTVVLIPPHETYIKRASSFFIDSDQPVTYINRKGSMPSSDKLTSRSHAYSSFVTDSDLQKNEFRGLKSSTLPGHRSPKTKPPNLGLPGFPYRAPSPILLSGHGTDRPNLPGQVAAAGGKAASTKRSLFRRRAESVDTPRLRNT